jgi:hypothetical protein
MPRVAKLSKKDSILKPHNFTPPNVNLFIFTDFHRSSAYEWLSSACKTFFKKLTWSMREKKGEKYIFSLRKVRASEILQTYCSTFAFLSIKVMVAACTSKWSSPDFLGDMNVTPRSAITETQNETSYKCP